MSTMDGRLAALTTTAALAALACSASSTPTVKTAPTDDPHHAAPSLAEEAYRDHVEEVARLRDRDFQPPHPHGPPLKAHRAEPLAPVTPRPVVDADRRTILQGLCLDPHGEVPTPQVDRLAAWRPDTAQILYRPVARDAQPRQELALRLALVEALDDQSLPPLPAPKGWDEALAHQTSKRATGIFVAALAELGNVDDTTLAARPELIDRAPTLAGAWVAPAQRPSPAYQLQSRALSLTARASIELAAALHRAGGWSGVELLRHAPPIDGVHALQPARWFAGEGAGELRWPQDRWEEHLEQGAWQEQRRGRLGPFVATAALAERLPTAELQRAIRGFGADAYRAYRGNMKDGEEGGGASGEPPRMFAWVSHWRDPSTAAWAAHALEQVMEQRSCHWRVSVQGLQVALVTSTSPEGVAGTGPAALTEASARFAASTPLPLPYVPSRLEEMARASAKITLEDGRWSDPALALAADLSGLEGWQILRAQSAGVRWFARHPDGTLLQMTTELRDPLGPAFPEQAYSNKLRDALRESLPAGASVTQPQRYPHPLGDMIELTASVPHGPQLKLWHLSRGDLRISYSLQSPNPSRHGERLALAQRLLDQMEPLR